MKFVCEICNKKHDTLQAAEQCEQTHEKERIQRVAKETAEAKISDAINAFIARYGEVPNIQLTPENEKLAFGIIVAQHLEDAFDAIFDIFDDGEDRNANEGECKNCDHCGECHKQNH